jgi:hypothetical protein
VLEKHKQPAPLLIIFGSRAFLLLYLTFRASIWTPNYEMEVAIPSWKGQMHSYVDASDGIPINPFEIPQIVDGQETELSKDSFFQVSSEPEENYLGWRYSACRVKRCPSVRPML